MSLGQSLLRFLCTGVLNTAFGYAVYVLLVVGGTPLWLAVAGSTVLGVLFNFFSYGRLVFGPAQLGRLPAFIAVYVVLYALNVALAYLLTAWGVGALVAQALLLPFLAALAFLLLRTFVFGSPPQSERGKVHAGIDTDDAGPSWT